MAGYDFKIGVNTGDSSATIEKLIAEIKKIGITARQIVAVLTGQTQEIVDSFDVTIDEIDKVGEALSDVKDNAEDFGDVFEDIADGAKQALNKPKMTINHRCMNLDFIKIYKINKIICY
jgi:methyl-accepting chemotaxis protein